VQEELLAEGSERAGDVSIREEEAAGKISFKEKEVDGGFTHLAFKGKGVLSRRIDLYIDRLVL
jgi:hypothetical protein